MTHPTSRRLRSLVIITLVILAFPAAWYLPFVGQWRQEVELKGTLLPQPPIPEPWEITADEAYAGSPYMPGKERRWNRVWKLPNSRGVTQTVVKFTSPTWAALSFHRSNPHRFYAEDYDDILEPAPDATPTPPGADGITYACGEYYNTDQCIRWYVWIRYGQYIVDLRADSLYPLPEVGLRHAIVPTWLRDYVFAADRQFREATER